MKTLKNLLYAIVVLTFAASCSSEEFESPRTPNKNAGLQYMEFTASIGANTRTLLTNDNNVEWVAGDEISIFDGTANRKFTTKDNGASAIFGGVAKEAETYYALYPYQEGAIIQGNIIKNVTIPVVQEAKAGSFDEGINISVASASTDLQLAFKNVGSLVKFSISNDKADEVRSVKLTSNDGTAALAGTVNITVGATPTVTAVSAQNQVTLKSDTGFEKDKDYYFTVLPGTLFNGFSLTFTDKDNKTLQKVYTTETNLSRSIILKLNDIELGNFTTGLLTNLNLIAAAEASTGQAFTKNVDGTVNLNNVTNRAIVEAVTTIDVTDKNDATIADELFYFTGLKVLKCSGNNITALDLTANTALEELYCIGNELHRLNDEGEDEVYDIDGVLSSLDISNCLSLQKLYVDNNKLSQLDVYKKTALKELSFNRNEIHSIDLSSNLQLTYLECHLNGLTSLNVSNNIALLHLHCAWQPIRQLDLTHNTELEYLHCHYIDVTELDLSNNKKLKYLYLWGNPLETLDVSNNTNLEELDVNFCGLKELDLSQNTKLYLINLIGNNLTDLSSLVLSNKNNLDWFACYLNHISELDISNTTIGLNCHMGYQKDNEGNDIVMTLYVNPEQYNQEMSHDSWDWPDPNVDDVNANINLVIKSDATHEGYNESNYGG